MESIQVIMELVNVRSLFVILLFKLSNRYGMVKAYLILELSQFDLNITSAASQCTLYIIIYYVESFI